jgi:Clustered mitochondria
MKHGQFFKLPEDEHNLYGDDLLACKAASHELWSLQYLISCSELELSFPLMANIDLLGRRVTVSTCLPIGGDSLHYGTADAGRTMFGRTDLPSEALAKVGK